MPTWAKRALHDVVAQAGWIEFEYPPELELQNHSPEAVRAWFRVICEFFQIKPTELARKSGIAPSTINRFLSGKADNENISAATISKVKSAVDELVDQWIEDVERGRLTPIEQPKPKHSVRHVRIVGAVEAGVFLDAVEWPEHDKYRLELPIQTPYVTKSVVGFEVRGESMNLLYPAGTIIVCVPTYDIDRRPIHGERIVVFTRQNDLMEATVKEFRIDDDGVVWLWPRSSEPAHQSPIRFGELHDRELVDNETSIVMIVIGSYRPEP